MSEIHQKVRAWAEGLYPVEAGTELLIRTGFVISEQSPWIVAHGDRARIDVDELIRQSAAWSGGEQRMIRIAASLLSTEHPCNLNDDVPGLDREYATLVLAAIAHASGSHEHSGLTYDDNGQPDGFTRLTSLYPWPVDAADSDLDANLDAR